MGVTIKLEGIGDVALAFDQLATEIGDKKATSKVLVPAAGIIAAPFTGGASVPLAAAGAAAAGALKNKPATPTTPTETSPMGGIGNVLGKALGSAVGSAVAPQAAPTVIAMPAAATGPQQLGGMQMGRRMGFDPQGNIANIRNLAGS